MDRGSVVILRGSEVEAALSGREAEILEAVAEAYRLHARGETSLPHSTFLRFPDLPANRIIALPAYLGAQVRLAGMKWVASAPANTQRGLDRASAVVVLNEPETGRPWALLEGSLISAARTAASAALAARVLHGRARTSPVGLIGCGRIQLEMVRFLRAAFGEAATSFLALDLDAGRAASFAGLAERTIPGVRVERARELHQVLAECPLVAFATTAVEPYVADLAACAPGATILHVSLRDLSPQAILASDNVVDDLDHVCRAQTSIHLAEQVCGGRSFVRCSLGEILCGAESARPEPERITVFSPFGLGILDLAVAKLAYDLARDRGLGTEIDSFLPGLTAQPVDERAIPA